MNSGFNSDLNLRSQSDGHTNVSLLVNGNNDLPEHLWLHIIQHYILTPVWVPNASKEQRKAAKTAWKDLLSLSQANKKLYRISWDVSLYRTISLPTDFAKHDYNVTFCNSLHLDFNNFVKTRSSIAQSDFEAFRSKFPECQSINFSHTHFARFLSFWSSNWNPELSSWPSLKEVNFSWSSISSSHLVEFFNLCPNLVSINLNRASNFDDMALIKAMTIHSQPERVKKRKEDNSLISLSISRTLDGVPKKRQYSKFIGKYPALQNDLLKGPDSTIITILQLLGPELCYLDISRTGCSSPTIDAIVKHCTKLTTLMASHISIFNDSLKHMIQTVTSIQHLDISFGNDFSVSAFRFEPLPEQQFETLNLNSTFTEANSLYPQFLRNYKNVENDMESMNVTPPPPRRFENDILQLLRAREVPEIEPDDHNGDNNDIFTATEPLETMENIPLPPPPDITDEFPDDDIPNLDIPDLPPPPNGQFSSSLSGFSFMDSQRDHLPAAPQNIIGVASSSNVANTMSSPSFSSDLLSQLSSVSLKSLPPEPLSKPVQYSFGDQILSAKDSLHRTEISLTSTDTHPSSSDENIHIDSDISPNIDGRVTIGWSDSEDDSADEYY